MRVESVWLGMFIGFAYVLCPNLAQAQFSCGSTGARGALVVAEGELLTLSIPDDGLFHFSTITVSGNVEFSRNPGFNPPVVLLSTGDITINPLGRINVNGLSGTSIAGGLGGPGGFDGGAPGIAAGTPGAGHGPGAGAPGIGDLVGGNAAYGGDPFSDFPTDGVPYGSSLLVPIVGGSGGGGDDGFGGGGGGGAILLCSPTRAIINGTVEALGGVTGSIANGSGGAVRILSPFVGGTGLVNVQGGGGWAHGRIRVDLIDRTGLTVQLFPTESLSVGSFMAVFPSTVPRLDIVHVAGSDIPPGTPSPLVFTLPFNSPPSQPITVRATGFRGTLPVVVVVTPDSGDRIIVETEIDTDVAPAEATVNVDLPQNVVVRIHAWTR